MLKVCVGGYPNDRKTVMVDENTSLRSVLEDNGRDYLYTRNFLNGIWLQELSDLDKTFKEYEAEKLNKTPRCDFDFFLICLRRLDG